MFGGQEGAAPETSRAVGLGSETGKLRRSVAPQLITASPAHAAYARPLWSVLGFQSMMVCSITRPLAIDESDPGVLDKGDKRKDISLFKLRLQGSS